MEITSLIWLILILTTLFFMVSYILFFPVVTLVNCSKRKDIGPLKKGLYLIGMLITWFFGSTLYAVFSAPLGVTKVLAVLFLSLALIIPIGPGPLLSYQIKRLPQKLELQMLKLEQSSLERETSQRGHSLLKTQIETLILESKEVSFFKYYKRLRLLQGQRILKTSLEDKKMTALELEAWERYFNKRDELVETSLDLFSLIGVKLQDDLSDGL